MLCCLIARPNLQDLSLQDRRPSIRLATIARYATIGSARRTGESHPRRGVLAPRRPCRFASASSFAFRCGSRRRCARSSASAMRLPAAKGTPQVVAPGVAGVGQKENPAMPAPCQAPFELRLAPYCRSQNRVIRQDQTGTSSPRYQSGQNSKCSAIVIAKKQGPRLVC